MPTSGPGENREKPGTVKSPSAAASPAAMQSRAEELRIERFLDVVRERLEGESTIICSSSPDESALRYRNYRDHLVDNENRLMQERIDMYASASNEEHFGHFMSCYETSIREANNRVRFESGEFVSFNDFRPLIMRSLEILDPDFNFQYVKFMGSLRSEMAGTNEGLQRKLELLATREFIEKTVTTKKNELETAAPDFLTFVQWLLTNDYKLVSYIRSRDFLDLLQAFKRRNYFRKSLITRLNLEKNDSKNLLFLLMDRGYHFGMWFVNPMGEAYQTCDILYKLLEGKRIPFTNRVIYKFKDHYAKIDCEYEPFTVEDPTEEFTLIDHRVTEAKITEFTLDEQGVYRVLCWTQLEPAFFAVCKLGHPWHAREYWDLTREDCQKIRPDIWKGMQVS